MDVDDYESDSLKNELGSLSLVESHDAETSVKQYKRDSIKQQVGMS